MTVRVLRWPASAFAAPLTRVLGGVSDAERGPSVLGQDLAVKVDERDAGLFDEDVHFLLGMRVGDLERDAVEGDRAVVVHHPCSFTGLV